MELQDAAFRTVSPSPVVSPVRLEKKQDLPLYLKINPNYNDVIGLPIKKRVERKTDISISKSRRSKGGNGHWVDSVITHILECPLEQLRELTLTQLARFFSVSRSSINNRFKKELDITPGRFILREKMWRAAYIIVKEPRLQVQELSEKLGFCCSDYFIQVFREHFGVTPCKYRQIKRDFSGAQQGR